MSSPKQSLRKEACWTISNITAGSKEQIQAVIDANIIPPLVDKVRNGEPDVRKEAAWAIANATSGALPEQVSCQRSPSGNFLSEAPTPQPAQDERTLGTALHAHRPPPTAPPLADQDLGRARLHPADVPAAHFAGTKGGVGGARGSGQHPENGCR